MNGEYIQPTIPTTIWCHFLNSTENREIENALGKNVNICSFYAVRSNVSMSRIPQRKFAHSESIMRNY